MKRTPRTGIPRTGTPGDTGPARPGDLATALEAYLRACGVSSLIMVSLLPARPGGTSGNDRGGPTTGARLGEHDPAHPEPREGLVHLECWEDILRTRAALADHPAVAGVYDGPATAGSLCWSLRFTLPAPGTPQAPWRR